MLIARFVVACLLWLLAAVLLVPAVHLLRPRTLSLDRAQLQYLSYVAEFAQQSNFTLGRMPTEAEYLAWFQSREVKGLVSSGPDYAYSSSNLSREAISQFGKPPDNAYTVTFWNGKAFVAISSWQADPSTAVVDDTNYLFGNRVSELLVFLSLSACLAAAAFWLLSFSSTARANPSVKGTCLRQAPYVER